MKTMYQCEKCGKLFSDYDEAWKHDNSHWTVERGYNKYTATLDSLTEYEEGIEEPVIVHLVFERWNTDKNEYEARCGKYKLISSYEAPEITEE